MQSEASVAIRLGRVLHWSFSLAAFCTMFFGIATSVIAYQAHQASLIEIVNWHQQHPHLEAPKLLTLDELPDKPTDAAPPPELVPPPVEVPAAPERAIEGLVSGLAFLFMGRAIRYVVAGE